MHKGKTVFVAIGGFILLSIVYLYTSTHSFPCANTLSCSNLSKLQIENNAIGVFNGTAVVPPSISLTDEKPLDKVLGIDTDTQEKYIHVDLTKQTLTAYQGSEIVMQTLISSGKTNRTPTGEFTIWTKVRAQRMSGGSGSGYYSLPNVPYVMFFSNNQVSPSLGYSFHGAYWHNNFGHAMSHGCINMRTVDAEKLYNWVDSLGVKVIISGEAPV